MAPKGKAIILAAELIANHSMALGKAPGYRTQ
jgi:hypothetical protein